MRARTLALAIDLGGTRSMPHSSTPTARSSPGSLHRAPTGRDASRDEVAQADPWRATAALAGADPATTTV